MDWPRILLSRIASLFRRRRLDADLEEELRAHIDLATRENIGRGMTQQQARSAALRSFGGVTQIQESYRNQRGIPVLEQCPYSPAVVHGWHRGDSYPEPGSTPGATPYAVLPNHR